MTYISAGLRTLTAERARSCCEYCRIPSLYYYSGFEIDHVIAQQHGGSTFETNLCLTCDECNRHKGPNLSSVDWEYEKIERLYNPRTDSWSEHFQLQGPVIVGLTPHGRVTVFLLQFNQSLRISLRIRLISAGLYLPALNP